MTSKTYAMYLNDDPMGTRTATSPRAALKAYAAELGRDVDWSTYGFNRVRCVTGERLAALLTDRTRRRLDPNERTTRSLR